MAKTKTGKSNNGDDRSSVAAKKKVESKKRRNRREVQVVSCPSDFPISSKSINKKQQSTSVATAASHLQHPEENKKQQQQLSSQLLDWNDTAKEIRSLAATSFIGQKKRNYEDEEYERLTGRKKKKEYIPMNILRGMRKKQAKRLEREIQEAKEIGRILPTNLANNNKKKQQQQKRKLKDKTEYLHGPAPSSGFMSKGVLKVKRPL